MLRRFFIVGALFLGAGIVVVIGGVYALLPLCPASIIQEAVSPDGRYRAVVSEGGCGATTPVTTSVTVERNFDTLLAKGGKVFFAKGDRFSLQTSICWVDSRTLIVSGRGFEDAYVAESKLVGVTVEFVSY